MQMSDTAPNSKSSNWLSTLYHRIFKRSPNQAGTQGNAKWDKYAAPQIGSIANPLILSNGYYELDKLMKKQWSRKCAPSTLIKGHYELDELTKKAREENNNMMKNAIDTPASNTQPTNVDIHDSKEGGDPSLSARQAAVSMRERAMECVTIPGLGMRPEDIITHIKNAIAQLPDFE